MKKAVPRPENAEDRRELVIANALERHQPYKVFADPTKKRNRYSLVYDRPVDMKRTLIMADMDKVTATDIKELLERAWAEGLYANIELSR